MNTQNALNDNFLRDTGNIHLLKDLPVIYTIITKSDFKNLNLTNLTDSQKSAINFINQFRATYNEQKVHAIIWEETVKTKTGKDDNGDIFKTDTKISAWLYTDPKNRLIRLNSFISENKSFHHKIGNYFSSQYDLTYLTDPNPNGDGIAPSPESLEEKDTDADVKYTAHSFMGQISSQLATFFRSGK